MKNVIRINVFVALIALLVGCSQEEVSTWMDKGRVWFSSADTLNFTFAQHPDVDSYIVQLPVTLAGTVAENDRAINVAVSSPARDSETKYEILTPVIEQGATSGNLNIKVYRTDNLDTAADTISFTISASEELEVGLEGQLTKTLVVYNHYVKPTWWGMYTEWVLGRFTEKKCGIIDNLIGLSNIKGGRMMVWMRRTLGQYGNISWISILKKTARSMIMTGWK